MNNILFEAARVRLFYCLCLLASYKITPLETARFRLSTRFSIGISFAKKAFEEARNRLAQASEINSKILANEIAMALAIINDPLAQRGFESDINLNKSNANSNSNIGTNSINNPANSANFNVGLGNN